MDNMDMQPGMNEQPQVPQNPQQPGMPQVPPAPVGGSMMAGPVDKGSAGLRWGTGIMLGAMILLIPLGLYKIGSPAPCTPERQKRGECTVLPAVPDKCTPSAFSEDVKGLNLLMTNLIDRKTKESIKNGNLVLETKPVGDEEEGGEVERVVFPRNPYDLRCFAAPGLIKFKYKNSKKMDIIDIPELDILKMNALTNVDPSLLSKDLIMTILIMILLMGLMGFAGWTAIKKDIDGYGYIFGVFFIGFLAAYLYRYYVAAFYTQDIVVLLLSLLGAIPIGMLMAAKPKKQEVVIPDYMYGTAGRQYVLEPGPVQIEDVSYGELDPSQMTPFIRDVMKKDYLSISLVGGFLLVVLSLIPIGLIGMSKTSNANQAMQKEAAKLSMLVKKRADQEASFDMGTEDDGGDADDEGDGE